jgi:predicted DNA-binding transcriptional regulator AlpA
MSRTSEATMENRMRSVPEPPSNVLLTPRTICKILSISRRTLRYWVKKDILPQPLRLGPDGRTLRWHPADLVDYLKRTRGPAAAQGALHGFPHDGGAAERRP